MNERAEHWFMRLRSHDCSAAEREACLHWRNADPGHAAAYAEVEQLYRLSDQLGVVPDARTAAQAARARAALEGRRRRQRRRWMGGLALAATLVLAVGLGKHYWPTGPAATQVYATALGERRSLTLEDGSRVELDADSAVQVRYTRQQRQLVLQRGRAQFEVTPAPRRPFVVQVGERQVRALGTTFQVQQSAQAVVVTLLQGSVLVSDAHENTRLAPGEQLTVPATGAWQRSQVDRQVAAGWTEGQLIFHRRLLHEVVEEANRYATPPLRIGDPVLAEQRITGTFGSHDQASLVQAIEAVLDAKAELQDGELVLRRR